MLMSENSSFCSGLTSHLTPCFGSFKVRCLTICGKCIIILWQRRRELAKIGEKSPFLSPILAPLLFYSLCHTIWSPLSDYKARGRPLFILLFVFSCDTGNEVIHSVVSLLLYHRPVIHHTVSLEDACDTIQNLLSQQKVGKVVVRM